MKKTLPDAFRYADYGNLATIGHSKAVVDFCAVRLEGLIAWILWSVAHVYFLIGFRNRFFVATGFLDGGRMWNDGVIEAVRGCTADSVDAAEAGLPERLPLRDASSRRGAIDRVIKALKYLPPAERAYRVDAFARTCGVELPRDLMMTSDQVRALHRAGKRVGAHTVHHPILARHDADEARREIAGSRAALQALLDDPVSTFAYPNGQPEVDYSAHSVALVRELGFELAVSTAWGAAARMSDPYQLPRFTPWDPGRARFAPRLAGNYFRTPMAVCRPRGTM